MTTRELQELDKRCLWHPFTHVKLWNQSDPLIITHAKGMHLIDSDGNRYLDAVSSLWCNVHGHGVSEIDDAIRAQLGKVAHSTLLGLGSEQSILLAERLLKIVPANLKKVFYSDSGATATEIAFKLAVQYFFNIGRPGKNELVGFVEAYHGDTFGAMAVAKSEFWHKPYWPMLFKTHMAPSPYVYRSPTPDSPLAVSQHCLDELETILREHHETIAAVCIEPIVQGAAGMIVHPPGFLKGVRELASKYDVLLIADEVATGFGRSGKMFACEHEDVQPDLMAVAKGITGGYLPLAATLATQKIYDAFVADPWEGKTFYHGHTYTGNALACAAAMASLDLFDKNDMVHAVERKSIELSKMLEPLKSLKHVGEIRQKGFMVGIELVQDRATRKSFDSRQRIGAKVCRACQKHGVFIRPILDTIILMPPLAMEEDDLCTIVNALHTEITQLSL